MATPAGVAVRFWSYVAIGEPGDCWNWTGYLNPNGYAQFRPSAGIRVYAHRWAYESSGAKIPAGYEIDHLCRNRKCVNPAHLEPVTHAENHRRRTGYMTGPYNVGDECRHGHRRTPENTGVNRYGYRFCRPCVRAACSRAREKRKASA